jgi:hypothetical protein
MINRFFYVFIATITLNILFLSNTSVAQYYQTGTEPFNTKWKIKRYNNIRLIFPENAENISNNYLWALNLADSINDTDYREGDKRIDVVLHPNSVLSNGFVSWAPRRMELITQPSPDGEALMWYKNLAIHEMRHVKQMYSLRRGTFRILSWLLGEQAVGLASGIINPWIFEGDAVWAETSYSYAGRGRSASFFKHYYTHSVTNQKRYTYDKWMLGSYKHYIPNHYAFGYQMVKYINESNGSSAIPNTYRFVGRFPFTIFPTYLGLKFQTGLSRKRIFKRAFAHNDSIWKNDFNNHPNIILPAKRYESFKNFKYPYPINDSITLVYVESIKTTPFFAYLYKNGKFKKIKSIGYLIGKPTFTDSLILWAEYKPHPRWEYKNQTEIKIFNLKTKELATIGNGRYFSPVFYNKRKLIYCISYNDNGSFSLLGLNRTGKVISTYDFSPDVEIQEITIDQDKGNIYGICVTETGKKLFKIDSNNEFSIIFDAKYNDLRSISYGNSSLFFSLTNGYTENIYQFDLKDSILYSIKNLPVNSTFPFPYKNGIVFSGYSPKGYRVAKNEISLSNRLIVDSIPLYNQIVKANNLTINQTPIPIKASSKDYSGVKTLINVHSWFPFYVMPIDENTISIDGNSIVPGFSVLSQNLKGTSILNAGYGYDQTHLYYISYTYRGFWPIVKFNIEQSNNSATLYRVTQSYPTFRDYQKRFSTTIILPYTFKNGLYNSYAQVFNKFEYSNSYIYKESIDAYRSGLYTNELGVYYQNLRRMAHRDLYPRYGIQVIGGVISTPWDYSNLGNLWYGKGVIYLPGIFRNNSLRITGQFQEQDVKYFYLNNKFNMIRGYNDFPSVKFAGISLDYSTPVLYPDLTLSSIAYVKRISINLFADFASNRYKTLINNSIVTLDENLQSSGFDILIDFHLFRTWYPFRLKITQGFMGKERASFSNISLNIDINSNFARH